MIKALTDIDNLYTLTGVDKKDGRNLVHDDLSPIKNAAIVFDTDKIMWVGKTTEIPTQFTEVKKTSLKGYIVFPEFVDSHTHLVFGGNRAQEYRLRLEGASYETIYKSGGGILHTTKHSRDLNEDELFELGKARIEKIKNKGIGTIEIKSGYGLDYENEKKLSQVILRLKEYFKPIICIKNTYMAAHAIPSEFESSSKYLHKVVLPLLDELNKNKSIDAVDIFYETGYFDIKDTRELFTFSSKLGINTKMHADEFVDGQGAALASELNCLSADHLLQTSETGMRTLAKSKTVATFLPGTSLFLGKPFAKAKQFADYGAKIAIASDFNPGSCHCYDLLRLLKYSIATYRLNQCQAIASVTYNAAHALGIYDQGVITTGHKPRFSISKCKSVEDFFYSWDDESTTLLADLQKM